MRWKYVEERHRRWFVFGEHRDGVHVDISDGEGDVFERLDRRHVKMLLDERDKLVDALCEMAMAFDAADHDAFTKFWYGEG